ncbi:type VII secretion integral membrane protein EccD [Streptomyces sp. NBC_00102]|uniref:type VII secretion integral membrane protein EccD n=1 Tax=Streptomyces sp. NBC_00102 TaxID=2975652 RepID=UPI002250F33F|nr:type VII secretion integral membrane protein EccD [Streptomyces sp. NBC_00102]MCX5400456.1 type VII secretion integral membrane protein EccD [Streptomyces sp. NBC_00102]
MTDNALSGLCRLTVRAPDKTVDLSVPADIPVADLLPAVLAYAGDGLAEAGVDHDGWVLQRLGGRPLDHEATLEAQDAHDGEVFYLRPHAEALPEVRLDDLVDGIYTTMRDQPFGWTPLIGKRVLLTLAALCQLLALVVLALSDASGIVIALAAFAFGMLTLGGAAAASRAIGDAGAGATLGVMVPAFLASAGWTLPGGQLSGPDLHEVLGARLLAASTSAAAGAVLAVAAVAAFATVFLALAAVAGAGALGGVLLLVADLPPEHASGILAVTAVVFGAFVPSLSFRLAGLRMPPIPTNAEDLQEGIEPHEPRVVAERSVLADGWMTGLYAAAGIICAVCVAGLAVRADLAQNVTTATLSLLLLLHARGLGNTLQRLSLITPALLGAASLTRTTFLDATPGYRLLLVAGLLAVTAALAIASWTVPGTRMLPYWGRAAELAHSTAAIALLPLALWVLGVYGTLRALAA